MKTWKTLTALGIFLVLLGISQFAAGADVNITGKWILSIQEVNKVALPEFVLHQNGDMLTGMYKGRFGEAEVTGHVKGIYVEMAYTARGAHTIYKGTVKGNAIAGTANFNGLMIVDFVGEKQ